MLCCHYPKAPDQRFCIWWLWKRRNTGPFVWLLLDRLHRSSWRRCPGESTITTMSVKDLETWCWPLLQSALNLVAWLSCCFSPWLDSMKLKYTDTRGLVILLYLLCMLWKSKYRIRAAKLTSPGCVTGRVRVLVWVEVLREEAGSCPQCALRSWKDLGVGQLWHQR